MVIVIYYSGIHGLIDVAFVIEEWRIGLRSYHSIKFRWVPTDEFAPKRRPCMPVAGAIDTRCHLRTDRFGPGSLLKTTLQSGKVK